MKTMPNNIRLIVLQCINLILSGCTVYGYAPIGIGYFCALYTAGFWRLFSCITMFIGMAGCMNYVQLIKYVMVVCVYIALTGILSFRKEKVSVYVYGVINFVSMFALEMTDKATVSGTEAGNILTIAGVCLLSSTLMIVFTKGIEGILNISRVSVPGNEEVIGIASLCGICAYIGLKYVSFPYAILESGVYLLLLYFAYRYGSGIGAIIGAGLGVALGIDISNIDIVAIMCITAIVAGGLRELGKCGTVIAMLCCLIIGGLQFVPELVNETNVQGMVTASIIFMILPSGIIFKEENPISEVNYGNNGYVLRNKLNMLSESVKMLCESLQGSSAYRDEEMDRTCQIQETMRNICRDCSEHGQCRERGKVLASLLSGEKPDEKIACGKINHMDEEVKYTLESSRISTVWRKRLEDMRENVSEQLKEVSGLMEKCMESETPGEGIEEEKYKIIRKKMRRKGISVCAIQEQESESGIRQISVTMKCDNGKAVTSGEVNEIISDALDTPMRAEKDEGILVGDEYKTIAFRKKEYYTLDYAVSGRSKDGGNISGDNHGIKEIGDGKWMVTLADGMGTGIEAFRDSEQTVEYMERLLSAGFSRDSAVNMLNCARNMDFASERTTSVDVGILNMYTGVCDFVKMGAASTFIKRNNWVDVMRSTSCPVGIVKDADMDTARKKIYPGDMIVMVSDGVLDGIHGDNKEMEVSMMLMEHDGDSPDEMADRILNRALTDSLFSPSDDMTVVVATIQET